MSAPSEQSLPDVAADVAQGLGMQLASFLFPLLVVLDQLLDKRLVRTFLGSLQSILAFRDRIHGLLLTELGAALLSPEREGAGTKRLANLIHSHRWSSQLIDAFLWSWATTLLEGMVAVGQEVYAIWDESVWEKPESIKREDLGPVRSSKAHRLTHVKPGSSRPPRRPIFVPGLNWLGVILVGAQPKGGVPCLAALRWWSNRGPQAERKRKLEAGLLLRCIETFGRRVLHLFDRGFATEPWLHLCVIRHRNALWCAGRMASTSLMRKDGPGIRLGDRAGQTGLGQAADLECASAPASGDLRPRLSGSSPRFCWTLVVSGLATGEGTPPLVSADDRRGAHGAASLEGRLCLCAALGYRGNLAL
jgi:hypothetical protein